MFIVLKGAAVCTAPLCSALYRTPPGQEKGGIDVYFSLFFF